MKHLLLCLLAVIFSTALKASVLPITGPTSVCIGSYITLSDATSGGLWSSSSPAIATVGSSTGVVFGVFAGSVTITYTVGASYATYAITVNPIPSPITGPSSLCLGTSAMISSSTPGGVWSISPTTIISIAPLTGLMTGVSVGTATITYVVSSCFVTHTVTVLPSPAPIAGATSICVGGSTTLTDATPGGTWVSSTPGIATITSGGVTTGGAVGIASISYVISTGCAATTTVTVTASTVTLYSVTGGGAYCAGGAGVPVGLAGSQVGVNYQLYNGGSPVGSPVAGTGSAISFGSITTAGTYSVIANPGTSCATTMTGSAVVSVDPLPTVYTVTGGGHYCLGGTGLVIGLSNSDIGVNYQLYNGTIMVGSPVAGTGSGISFGSMTAAGTYTVLAINTLTGCVSNMAGSALVVVDPLPVVHSVTGGGSYCSGGTGLHIGLSSSDVGVNYQLFLGSSAVGAPIAGSGASIDFGLITVAGTYTVVATNATTSCANNMTGSATITIATVTTPTVSISATPGTTVCPGTTVNCIASYTSAGTSPTFAWTLNGAAVATGPTYSLVPITGDVVGVTITSSDPCASPATATTTVVMTVGVPTVTATASTSCGGFTTLTAAGAVSYSWSPSTSLGCSSCSSTSAAPTSTTIYTVTGTDGFGCSGNASVTVDANRISGYITYTGSSTDTFKVWLVQFNPSDSSILALDSTYSCMVGGTNPYYEFMDAAAGNYLVKAQLLGTTPGTSSYIPTYSLSTPNWYSATGLTHAAATDTMHINMVYGTVPPGPGFISGYVVSGAGRGTSGEVPEPDMIIYLLDATTGAPITYTYTDAAGLYSFTGLGYGSYRIAPEDYKYYTTVSDVIVLDATNSSKSAVGFKKHTTFGNITPYAVENVAAVVGYNLSVFPNPVTSELTISWPDHISGTTASVSITDMSGRVAFINDVDLSSVSVPGTTQLNLTGIPNGIYHLVIKANSLYYTSKLVVAH